MVLFYLMDTVDLGEEPPLDIVPLKEQDSYLLTFKILWLWAYPSHTTELRDLSHQSMPCQENSSSDLKALEAFGL